MWPLLALSLLSITFVTERAIFWGLAHRRGRHRWLEDLADRLRAGDVSGARAVIASDKTIYARIALAVLDTPVHQALAVEMLERFRRTLERYSTLLSTIVTAAPLLGILGTVLGIIESFDLLGQTRDITDLESVASGIAQALITTAFGLVIALVTLFPWMLFRAQADRAAGAIDLLVASRLAANSGAEDDQASSAS